jgi:hypothetical protein
MVMNTHNESHLKQDIQADIGQYSKQQTVLNNINHVPLNTAQDATKKSA